jgi:hypothetical protein
MPEGFVSNQLKQQVFERAAGCCEYCRCQARFAMQSFSVEHIIPVSRGGATTLDNLALACQGCNNHKYARLTGRDPVSSESTALFHPRQNRWRDHFVWNEDFIVMIGLTPVGRATVEALQLNREGVVNLRRILYAMGEHPPVEAEPGD